LPCCIQEPAHRDSLTGVAQINVNYVAVRLRLSVWVVQVPATEGNKGNELYVAQVASITSELRLSRELGPT